MERHIASSIWRRFLSIIHVRHIKNGFTITQNNPVDRCFTLCIFHTCLPKFTLKTVNKVGERLVLRMGILSWISNFWEAGSVKLNFSTTNTTSAILSPLPNLKQYLWIEAFFSRKSTQSMPIFLLSTVFNAPLRSVKSLGYSPRIRHANLQEKPQNVWFSFL